MLIRSPLVAALIGCVLADTAQAWTADWTDRTPRWGLVRAEFHTAALHNKRDPYWPHYDTLEGQGEGEHWTHHIGLKVDTNLWCGRKSCLYWDQFVIGDSTNVQYREVTWEFELGWKLPFGTPYWSHQSRHHLDPSSESGQVSFLHNDQVPSTPVPSTVVPYPLRDRIGIKWCLYGCRGQR